MGTGIQENTREVIENRVVRMADRPITFARFLELVGEDDDVELVDGLLVEKMSAQLEHEKLFAWLFQVAGTYVEKRGLGLVLGSRTAVEISAFSGRLPDILFVRRERSDIVQEKAIYGPPDLVIELVSPNDRSTDLIGLEADYCSIEVAEIVFIDQQKRRIRFLRKHASGYEESELTEGTLHFEAIPGLILQIAWIFEEPRPPAYDTVTALLPQS